MILGCLVRVAACVLALEAIASAFVFLFGAVAVLAVRGFLGTFSGLGAAGSRFFRGFFSLAGCGVGVWLGPSAGCGCGVADVNIDAESA